MVEPIRDMKKVEDFLKYLRGSNERDYVLALLQLNTGLRISDVVDVKVSDVYVGTRFKEYWEVTEKKTKKQKKITINNDTRAVLKEYIVKKGLSLNDYIFPTRKRNICGHISTIQAYRILKKAATATGIESFGTHSLRKTWGYHSYRESKHNIGLLMDIFSHSKETITLGYIGISQDQKDELYQAVSFKIRK